MYREERCVTPPPTLQCVIVIFPVVSNDVQVYREERFVYGPYITVCYCYISSGITRLFWGTERRGV